MKTILIIPAFNEEDSIESVVGNIRDNYPQFDYVVVNDGSHDSTADVCRKNGFRFLDLPINLGLSGAFQAGLKYAYKHDYDCAVQFDADGQHLPEYVQVLVDRISAHDIVIGSRFVTQEKPSSMRMLGSNLISWMIKVTTGQRINDPTSGMRAYNRRMIKALAFGPNLGPEPDTISYLIKKKHAKVCEVQVDMANRMAGESYLNMRRSAAYMAHVFFSVLFVQWFR